MITMLKPIQDQNHSHIHFQNLVARTEYSKMGSEMDLFVFLSKPYQYIFCFYCMKLDNQGYSKVFQIYLSLQKVLGLKSCPTCSSPNFFVRLRYSGWKLELWKLRAIEYWFLVNPVNQKFFLPILIGRFGKLESNNELLVFWSQKKR